MRNFTLYIWYQKTNLLLTQYDNAANTPFSEPYATFNEKLIEKENDQFELTFSMAGFVYDHHKTGDGAMMLPNYWLDLVKMGAYLRLVLDSQREITLVITKVTPTPTQNNVIYQFTAQDEVSYTWTRRRLGYSYSTTDRGGVCNIFTIAREVLEDNFLTEQWGVRDTEKREVENPLSTKLITLEVEDSNPYNVILEACNTLNCYMKVDYAQKYITFYQKDDIAFSGYRYHPEINLSQFSVNFGCDNFTSLMHVVGGTNEYDELITLVPAVPTAVMTWLTSESNMDKWSGIIEDGAWKSVWEIIPVSGLTYVTPDPSSIIQENGEADEVYHKRKTIAEEEREVEKQEIQDFITIAKHIPHLGHFLLNFDYFVKSGLMTPAQQNNLMNKFNQEMVVNNIYLKFYTPDKYKIEYRIAQTLQSIELVAQEYEAYCLSVVESAQNEDTDWSGAIYSENKMSTLGQEIYDLCAENDYQFIRDLATLYNIDKTKTILQYPEFQNYNTLSDSYQNKVIAAQVDIPSLIQQLWSCIDGNGDPDRDTIDAWLSSEAGQNASVAKRTQYTSLQSKLALVESNLQNYKTLSPKWEAVIDDKSYSIDGLYQFIIDNTNRAFEYAKDQGMLNNITNINEKIQIYENANHNLWNEIYTQYGQYIYEGKYENSDELDSVSLYNQGVTYFEDQKYPLASYSLTTIDLGALELIGLPRLAIGSKIKVYNKWLIDETETSRINYRNNELITTQITYDLRNAQNVQVSVDQVTPYSTIVQKLLQSVRR